MEDEEKQEDWEKVWMEEVMKNWYCVIENIKFLKKQQT